MKIMKLIGRLVTATGSLSMSDSRSRLQRKAINNRVALWRNSMHAVRFSLEDVVMRRVLVATGTVVLLSVSGKASAQCDALVRDGVFDTTSVSSGSTSASTFMNWVRDHHSNTSSSSAGGGLSIPVIGSLNGSEQQYQQLESDYAASQSGSSAATSSLTAHIRSVSTELAKQFNDCMKLKGLHVWLETTQEPKVFTIAAVYNSPSDRPNSLIKNVEFQPTSLSCGKAIAKGVLISGSTTRTFCRRVSSEAVAVIIDAQDDPIGGGELKLPRIVPPPLFRTQQKCDSTVLVSRGANASHPRMTDGVIGGAVGVNSGRAGGSFWVELSRPEWIHHVVLYPIQTGAPTAENNRIVGYRSDGTEVDFDPQRASATNAVPIYLYLDQTKSKDIQKIVVNTESLNGRDWIAWSEVEIFACH